MKETLREREMGQESKAQGISKAGTEERQRRTGQWEGAEERSFRAYLEREEKSRNTVEKYLRDARQFYAYMEEHGTWEDWKRDVLRYKEWLLERYKITSVNSMLAALNVFMRYKGHEECRVRYCRVQRSFFRPAEQELSREEYLHLVREAETEGKSHISRILQTLASTGIRVGELGCITVEALRQGYARIWLKGKERLILQPAALCRLLLAYCGARGIQEGSVFVTAGGSPVDRRRIWEEMKRLCRVCGIGENKGFPHNLRRLFARLYYEKEKNLARLADYLGHSSIETTRLYTMTAQLDACLNQLELGLLL